MITIRNCGYKGGYSGNDHLLDDAPLVACVGESFRSVRDIERRLNAIAVKTKHHKCALPPIWVEVCGDRLGVQKITV